MPLKVWHRLQQQFSCNISSIKMFFTLFFHMHISEMKIQLIVICIEKSDTFIVIYKKSLFAQKNKLKFDLSKSAH